MTDQSQTQRFSVSATGESATKTAVTARDFEFVVDEPASLGGTDDGPNPVEYLLGSLAGCLNVVAHVVADEYDFELRDVEIDLEGELDPAKFMGKRDDVRAGYQEVTATISVDADADDETLTEWLAEVEKRCPVSDNVQNETPLSVTLED
ncbi:OsmC family protein [Halobiforma nitratireducens]|nr:OsmC family protein [Halobiforma nitratireducens]